MSGRVILLNGTSSGGKTSSARALQATLDGYWLMLAFDDFATHVAPPRLDTQPEDVPPEVPRRMIAGFHGSIGAYARAGNDFIIDHVLVKPEWVAALAEALAGSRVIRVGVHCPLEEVERRERGRGDRIPGTARSQFDVVHAHGPYDVEVDTSVLGVEECVRRVGALLGRIS